MVIVIKNASHAGHLKRHDMKGHRLLILVWGNSHPAVLYSKSEQIYEGILLNKQISWARDSMFFERGKDSTGIKYSEIKDENKHHRNTCSA